MLANQISASAALSRSHNQVAEICQDFLLQITTSLLQITILHMTLEHAGIDLLEI